MNSSPAPLDLSPNPIWASFIGIYLFWLLLLFAVIPLGMNKLVRPFDKKFKAIQPTFEWGIPGGSELFRLSSYAMGIVLQKYRYNPTHSLLKTIVTGRFRYQDKVYDKIVDFREEATHFQVFFSYFFWIYFFIFILGMFPLLLHNFILYPEYG